MDQHWRSQGAEPPRQTPLAADHDEIELAPVRFAEQCSHERAVAETHIELNGTRSRLIERQPSERFEPSQAVLACVLDFAHGRGGER